jgi:hypothetical protein
MFWHSDEGQDLFTYYIQKMRRAVEEETKDADEKPQQRQWDMLPIFKNTNIPRDTYQQRRQIDTKTVITENYFANVQPYSPMNTNTGTIKTDGDNGQYHVYRNIDPWSMVKCNTCGLTHNSYQAYTGGRIVLSEINSRCGVCGQMFCARCAMSHSHNISK